MLPAVRVSTVSRVSRVRVSRVSMVSHKVRVSSNNPDHISVRVRNCNMALCC